MLTIHSAYFSSSNFDESSSVDETGEKVCISNISPLEQHKRLRFGVSQFILTLVILVVLIALGVDRLWRLPLLFLFWAATVGYFQARDKT